MASHIIQSKYSPLSLAEVRQELAVSQSDLMQRLASIANSPGHNSIIAADFTLKDKSKSGRLAGIPIGVKDNIDVKGFATTSGSAALRNYCTHDEGPCIAALREAGAILACKLNMHELAFGVTSDNPTFGRVYNPFDPKRTAGGSSGGTAAAVARGIVPVALGTDTGGSVRIPASFCGIVGFRPSTGRYPAGGVFGLSPLRDTIGPMAATVKDVAEIDSVLSGDPEELPVLENRKLRLGLPKDAMPGLCGKVETVFLAALNRLEQHGLIELVHMPELDMANMEEDMGFPIVFNEAYAIWNRFCPQNLHCSLSEFAEMVADPHVRETFALMPELSQQTSERFNHLIDHGLAELCVEITSLYDQYEIDFMVMPTTIVQPPRWEEKQSFKVDGKDYPTFFSVVRNTCLATLIGGPSLTIPAGLDSDGLPVGLMLDGLAGQDRKLLNWAICLEGVLPKLG